MRPRKRPKMVVEDYGIELLAVEVLFNEMQMQQPEEGQNQPERQEPAPPPDHAIECIPQTARSIWTNQRCLFGRSRSWGEVSSLQLQSSPMESISKDLLRVILRFVIEADTSDAQLTNCSAISLVCKRWCNMMYDYDCHLWWPFFKTMQKERVLLMGDEDNKYKMHPQCFCRFSFLQRWSCLRMTLDADGRLCGFSGYATFMEQKRGNTIITEGRFLNGILRKGVEYILGEEIKEGSFDSKGLIQYGSFEIWNPPSGHWITFKGDFNPQLGFRDFGTSTWEDGTTYTGEFKQCDRHGIGFMKDALEQITAAGIWENDELTIQFIITPQIHHVILKRMEDHRRLIAKAQSLPRSRLHIMM